MHQARIVLVGITLFTFAACRSDTVPPIKDLVPVTGTVTLDGRPLMTGDVRFAPVDQHIGQPAVGKIRNGRFNMITTVSSSGVVLGRYQILVESLDESKAPQAAPGEMPPPPPSLVPEKYRDPSQTDLEVEVTRNMPPLKLELKSR